MFTSFVRASGALCFLFAFVCLFAGTARGDIVWSPESGWRIEGGVLSELSGSDSRRALDLMNKGRRAEERGSRGSAIRAYKKVTKKYSSSIYAPEAYYRSGKLYLARKQYHRSFIAFQNTIQRYPNNKRFTEVVGEEYRIASALLDGARPRYWGWLPGFTSRERAIGYFELILRNAPYSDYAPLALMNIARGHLKLRNTEEAIDALDRMINNYSQSLLAPDAYLRLAQTHAQLVDGPNYDQGSTKEAITYFQDFMILFPNDQHVGTAAAGLDQMKQVLAESKMTIADYYFKKRKNLTAAKVFYNEAITAYPDSPVAERARQQLAVVEALANGQPKPDAPDAPKKKKRFFFF